MTTSRTPFNLVRVDINGHPVLVAYGELDVVAAPKMHEAFNEVMKEKPALVLFDMANVTFIDSSALGTLLTAHRHIHDNGGELRLVAVPQAAARIFEVTGLSERFHVYPDSHLASTTTQEVGESEATS